MPKSITNDTDWLSDFAKKSEMAQATASGTITTENGLTYHDPNYTEYLNTLPTFQRSQSAGQGLPDTAFIRNEPFREGDENLDLTKLYNGYSVENIRAEQQSGLEQLGNGIAKGLGLTATTFVNSTIGAIYGLGSMATGNSYYDNEFMDWTNSINEWFEETFPNYYTKEQQESAWYSPTNLLSANFWGDKFIKNLGFTAGAALAGGAFAGGLGSIGTALNMGSKASAITKGVGGIVLSSAGEASIEAYHTKNDFIKAKQMELDNKFLEDMQAIDAQYGNTEMGQRLKAERRHNYELASASIEEAGTQAGNMDWLLNMAILMPSNLIQFGKVFGGKDFTMAKKVARGELGQLKNPIGLGVTGTALKNSAAEGMEEVLQEVASRSSGFANEQGIYDLYELGQNNTSRNRAEEIVSGIGRGLVDALGDGSTWEQFFIGALTGALSSAGETVSQFKERKDYQKAVDYANSRINSGALKEEWQNLVRQQGTQSDMEAAAMSGDEASYKNAKHANIVSDIITFDKLGRLNDYKSFLRTAQGHLSDEDIESIIQSTGQNGPYVDENGNPKSYDEVRDIIKSKIDDNLKMVDKYQSIKDDIIKNSSRQLTDEELQNVLWYKMAWDNKQERIEKMGNELKDYFKTALVENIPQFENYTSRRKLSSINRKIKSKQKALDKLVSENKGDTKAAKDLEFDIKNLNIEKNNIKIVENPQSVKLKNLDEKIREKVKQRETILGGNRTLFTDSDVVEVNKEIEALTKEQKEAQHEPSNINRNLTILNQILNMQGGLSVLHILNNENLYNLLYDVIEGDKNTDSDVKASLMKKLNDIIDLNDQQNVIKENVDKLLVNPQYLPAHKAKIDAKYRAERTQQKVNEVKEKMLKATTFKDLSKIEQDNISQITEEAFAQIRAEKDTPTETKNLINNYTSFKNLNEQTTSILNNIASIDSVNKDDLTEISNAVLFGEKSLFNTAFENSLGGEYIKQQLKDLNDYVTPSQKPIVDELLDKLGCNNQIQPDFMTATPENDDDESTSTASTTSTEPTEATVTHSEPAKQVLDLTSVTSEEYEEVMLRKNPVLYQAIVDGTAEIKGVEPKQLNFVKWIAYKFLQDEGRERGNPLQPLPNRYDDNNGAGNGNSEVNDAKDEKIPTLRNWLYTKWNIESLKGTPQSSTGQRKAELFKPNTLTRPQEVEELDKLGAFDFVEKGYLADLYNAFIKEGKQLPIKLIQLGNNTQSYKSLVGHTLLAVEREANYNKLFRAKNFTPIEVNGVQYQIVGILGANEEGQDVLRQISNIVSNAHTNKEENYVHSEDMRIGHLYTGRMVLTNDTFPNLEERDLKDILNGEHPLFAMYYNDADIRQPFGGTMYGKAVSLNTNNPNSRDGSLWLLTKEADGRYYYKAVQIARYNDWLEKHAQETDNPILKKLKQYFAILCDKNRPDDRASAKGRIEDILYFPDQRLSYDEATGIIKFHNAPLNTEGSPEEMAEQCLEALKAYNLHFQIRPHHLANETSRNDIIQSGVITTNLAQLHNVNASFDLVIPQIEDGKIVSPKEPTARVVGHTGNPLNYENSHKSQVSIGSNSYYIDDNTLAVTTKDGASVSEDTASEIVLRHKIGNQKGLFEGSYNNGKKFYIRVTGDNVEIIREGTEAYNKLQEKNKKEEAKQNADTVVKQASDLNNSLDSLHKTSTDVSDAIFASIGAEEEISQESNSAIDESIFSSEPIASEEIQETNPYELPEELLNPVFPEGEARKLAVKKWRLQYGLHTKYLKFYSKDKETTYIAHLDVRENRIVYKNTQDGSTYYMDYVPELLQQQGFLGVIQSHFGKDDVTNTEDSTSKDFYGRDFNQELAELEKQQQSSPSFTSNETINKLKSDIQSYKEQKKRREVGSDKQETSMGNQNGDVSIGEQALKSFNKNIGNKETREALQSNNITDIYSFLDYCANNNLDISTAILSAESLKGWIQEHITCKGK